MLRFRGYRAPEMTPVREIFRSTGSRDGSEPLRILQIVPSLTVGGAEQMACHLTLGLSRSHSVGVVGLLPFAESSVEQRLQDRGIPKWKLNKKHGFDPRMFSAIARVVREFRPQVIHTHQSVLRYVYPILLGKNIPVVHTVHNLAERETDRFGRLLNRYAFRNKVFPVGISREVATSVKRVYGLECKAVIPNGIPVDHYLHSRAARARWRERESIPWNALVFTCVGRLEPQKNPQLLLDAFVELNDPRTHLVMAGTGSMAEQMREFVRGCGLTSRIHLVGKCPNIPDILAASDVFVLGSNWEGNPLAVMEAMAAGLPVIGTAVGGVPELVDTGVHGILVKPGDRAAFVNAMRSLVEGSSIRLVMANAARVRALTDFKVDRMVHGYASLYRAMVAEHNPVLAAC